jgi:hypothetical protein
LQCEHSKAWILPNIGRSGLPAGIMRISQSGQFGWLIISTREAKLLIRVQCTKSFYVPAVNIKFSFGKTPMGMVRRAPRLSAGFVSGAFQISNMRATGASYF